MAQTYELEAQPRTLVGKKVGRLRREGLVPVSVYGKKRESMNLQVAYRPLQVTLLHAGGTHLINLKVNGETQTVVAREVQRDPVKRTITYVDFVAVDKDTRLSAEVPVHLIGESPAVANFDGVILTGATTITVNSLATQIPDHIDVDLSKLVKLGDAITVADLVLPEGAIAESSPEEVIVRVAAPVVQTEEEVTEEATSAEPEVIKRGKADEEEGEE
ncbi:MAG: 50S ribosomal protein L25 [Anaerolineae bacterium]